MNKKALSERGICTNNSTTYLVGVFDRE